MDDFNPIWILAGIAVLTVLGAVGVAVLKFGEWRGEVNSDRAGFKTIVGNIEVKLDRLIRNIERLVEWQGGPALSVESPLGLSVLGKKISDDLDIPAMAKELVPIAKPLIDGMLRYDIQKFCFVYIRDEYKPSAEADKKIKEYAYQHGLDADDVLDVLSIRLLNELLGKE